MDRIWYSFRFGMVLSLIIFTSGCVSLPQNQQYSDLEERVVKLEERVGNIEKNSQAPQKKLLVQDKKDLTQKISDEFRPPREMVRFPTNEDIQVALKNAGLYDGKIDGQIGTKTRNAIKEFQKQNDLEIDGVVGRNTWEALSKFYYMPIEEDVEEEAQADKAEESAEEVSAQSEEKQ